MPKTFFSVVLVKCRLRYSLAFCASETVQFLLCCLARMVAMNSKTPRLLSLECLSCILNNVLLLFQLKLDARVYLDILHKDQHDTTCRCIHITLHMHILLFFDPLQQEYNLLECVDNSFQLTFLLTE